MKKDVKSPSETSSTPPKGWPSKKILKKAEKAMKDKRPTKLISDNAGPVERAKHQLCSQFINYRLEEKITQRELAQRLDVTESRVSEILHYHHDQFTIDRLLDLLNRVRPGVTLRVA